MTAITRRRFLRGAGVASAGAAAAALVGCGEGKPRPAPAVSPTPTAPPSAVTRGGVLRAYNFNAMTPDTFDPHLTQFGPIANVHSAIFSRILRYEDERAGIIAPDLADGMPEQPDDHTYIIRLREDVRFHDDDRLRRTHASAAGRALEASDVKFSIERQLNRNSPQAARFFHRSGWGAIDRIDVQDARTLAITLKSPTAPFLGMLAGRQAFILPREVVDRGRDEMNGDGALLGTGPFMLETFEPGVVVRLKRNPAWFARDDEGAGSRPFLDGYAAYLSPQEDTFTRAAFSRRLIDSTPFVDSAALDVERKTNLSDIVLEEADAGAVLAARLLLDRAPFRDDRIRRALHLAIDRRSLRDLLYPPMDGRPSARLSGPVAPAMADIALPNDELTRNPGYRENRAEDLLEARQLWTAATGGAAIGELRIFFAGTPRTIPDIAAAAVQRQLQEAFLVPVVTQVDITGTNLISAALARNIEGATEGVASFTFMLEDGGVDLDDWLYPHFRSSGPKNTYRLQDPTLDTQLDKQRAELDNEERARLGLAIQEYLIGQVNARLDLLAPVDRRLTWGYVRNRYHGLWHGTDDHLAGTWLDTAHPAIRTRPETI